MTINFSKFNNLVSLLNHFSTKEICLSFLEELKWGNEDGTITAVCPFCGHTHTYKCSDGRWICKDCGSKFSVLNGTIFYRSHIALNKWFAAIWLLSTNKTGVSSCQVARVCDIQQKHAWAMMQKIRTLIATTDVILDGVVEADECYIGGKEKNKHQQKKTPHNQGKSLKTKSAVFGMVERNGRIAVGKVDSTNGATLIPIISKSVAQGATINTDELTSYGSLIKLGYTHNVVNHKQNEYVVGVAYTNTIECFWKHLQDTIFGCYKFVSKEYFQRYIDECAYRWNTRKLGSEEMLRDLMMRSVSKTATCDSILMFAA